MFNPLQGRLAKRLAESDAGRPADLVLRQQRNRSGRGGAQARARRDPPHEIVATVDAFHGKTLGALSVSGSEVYREPFGPLVPDVVHVPVRRSRCAGRGARRRGGVHRRADPRRGRRRRSVARVSAGCARVCDRAGALLVADEVQTGLGRCGALFACDLSGVVPDVMTLAKGLSGGVVPIGAVIARAPVWNAAYGKAPLLHTSTFGGNELACAAALAALDVLVDDDLAANARERGAELLGGARALAGRFHAVIAARAVPGSSSASSCGTKDMPERSSPSCSNAALPRRGR